LDCFGNRCTNLTKSSKFLGVETPSQNRYVGYFQKVKEKCNGVPPEEIPLGLQQVKITVIVDFMYSGTL
ncbi:phosphatidylinositol-3,4,5-trisphosphate 3-phosphatase, partial [Caerostris darwini]